MRTIVIANQKGGVGKSAISSHLAFFAAMEAKLRTLVVDLDAQGTTTWNLTDLSAEKGVLTASKLFGPGKPKGKPLTVGLTKTKSLDLIPADEALSRVDETSSIKEPALRAALAAFDDQYDICIIDPPPTLGKRLRAALAASDWVLMPFIPVHESTNGLGQLNETVEAVRAEFNPHLQSVGFLANKVNPRSKTQARVIAQVAEALGHLMMPEILTERTAITDMLGSRRPVWQMQTGESHRKAATEMKAVCRAILKRVNQ